MLACVVADPSDCPADHVRRTKCVQPNCGVLLQNGYGHVRRSLRRACLRVAAGSSALRMADTARNAGRSWNGGDDPRTAHHGAPVRGLYGCLSQLWNTVAAVRGNLGWIAGYLGHVHSLLPLDICWRALH